MIKKSFRAFKLNGCWLSWIKAGREYALQTVADGICFVCLLGFAVCFWVLDYVLCCSAKRVSSRGRRVAFSLSGGSYYLELVKFSEWRKYQTFSDIGGLWSTAMLFWRASGKSRGWSTQISRILNHRDKEGSSEEKKAGKHVSEERERNVNMRHRMFVC